MKRPAMLHFTTLRSVPSFRGSASNNCTPMGGSASALNLAKIKLTEDEYKRGVQELYQPRVFDALADDNNMISMQALQELFKDKTYCYLTHDWGKELGMDNHARVSRVNEALKKRGLRTWFDSEQLKGNVKRTMICGIEQTHCVVVFITRRFMDKVHAENAEDNCQLEFNYACRRLTSRKMIPVVMESRMLCGADWYGEMGMALGGCLYVNLSNDDSFEERMDELYARILEVTGTTIQKVLDDPLWGELIAQKSQAAPATRPGAVDRGVLLIEDMQEWISEHTKIVPHLASTYAKQLVDIGVGSIDKLRKKLLRNAAFLDSLFDEDDAEELALAVMGQIGASKTSTSAVKEYQDLYKAYMAARTLGKAGKHILEEAELSSDQERAMVAKMLLALAYDGGGGTFSADKTKSKAYAAEVLPWMHEHALPPADEVIALKNEDPKPYALSTLVTAVLAFMIRDGVGCEKDEAKAVLYMKAAVPHGISMAQFLLGYAIKTGKGTAMNKEVGVQYYRLAAAQGYPMAIVNLGVSYYNGEGVPKDLVEACRWFKIVAMKGHSRGLYELGTMYYNGEGVDKDSREAVRLFQQSHDKGYNDGTYMLGACYAHGSGVTKDVDTAKALLQKAAAHGSDEAKALLDRLQPKLPPLVGAVTAESLKER